ncbi:extracellular matrix protein FRAS1 [Caerostris darwini]|uniref:Extracellular matrix protein FRAS1 n=1 Tax=Caerostris darwini TaxID=1538125 RepID=A0AAV4SP50_9ARAC|nr:extracellular matrix protein FRAS1 [Caerostris darwini]
MKYVLHLEPCFDGPFRHVHDDVWQSQLDCVLHRCQDGIIVPYVIQCPSIICSAAQKLKTFPGECCPKCVPDCSVNKNKLGSINNSADWIDQGPYISKECILVSSPKEKLIVLSKDPCTVCVNENYEEKCYSQKCPLCGSNAENFLNNSCCVCLKDTCADECLSCAKSDQNYCLDCKDQNKVLFQGKCITKCPIYYFSDENKECQSCPPSCKTCFGNMTSQCSSCENGYLLQKGQCVKNCDPNFYVSDGYCLECHESCLSCHGPMSSECISCALSGQLLQDGSCVDDCIGHFYIADGYCLECNESCARCLKDGTCQFCEDSFYLEEEYCVPECTPGYYKFLDAYCLSCHDECQGCFGPLPFQCTSCPFGQFLLENSCVWDCGQGYFGDLGAGICGKCHPDCRACLGGPSEDKCLTCSSGYLLPYIGTHFGNCVEECPAGYYLTSDGNCAACHESCKTCYGSNDTDCLSCSNSLFIKNGKCVPHCSNGFFQYGGICYACHPSCATCYGFNSDECYTCPFGRTFKYGKCISSCEEAKYMNTENLCSNCHSSCSDCLLNRTEGEDLQCLQCKHQQLSILYGECVIDCPSNFYLNSYQICQECHPTCATCERNGATSCVTCWNGNFLTHLGTCEVLCHQGYFPSNGVCQACSSNCHHCIGASECLQCKGNLVLQFGECLPLCSDQHYIDGVSRQCTECSRECNTCRGPSATDCTSCTAGKFFQDGSCVKNCSDGFVLKGNICEPCDLKCKTCSISNKCVSCDFPLLLRDGECVDDCGTGQYADYNTLTCKSCGLGCTYCLSSDECGLCKDGYHLHQFTCRKSCPENYFEDPMSRLCKRDYGAPSVYINSNLRVQAGSSILITSSVLNASHVDSEKLYVIIHELPQNSQLQKMSDKAEQILLKSGDNFTSRQLEDGWVFFKYLEGMPLQGDLVLKISDGYVSSGDIILPMQIVSKFAPEIGQLDYIVVPEESLVVINPSMLYLEDKDNIADVSLKVIRGPCFGKLVQMPDEKEISSITYEEFSKQLFAFKSFKTGFIQEDSFVIQAFDGFNSKVTDMKVIILPKNSNDLAIARNKLFYVKSTETSVLTNEFLLCVGENLKPFDILYTIERSSNPSIGQFFKKIDSERDIKEIKGDLISFTQADINNGKFFYNHPFNVSSKIKLMVENRKSKKILNFDFEISPVDRELETIMQDNVYGMMVLQNHPATISSDHLLIEVNGISPNSIVYMITKKLLKEEGFLENLNQPGVKLQSFTQNDVDSMKIVYHPPAYGGTAEKQFVFQFVVIDAGSGSQLSSIQNFTITVTPPIADLTSPASSIDHTSRVVVTQGQSVQFERNWFITDMHELSDDQLEVVITNTPQHGVLVQISGDSRTEVEEEDGFSFTSIFNDMFYEHDGSFNFRDSAVFSIMGGKQSTLNRVLFEISPNDRESPVILDSTTLMGSITEGKSLTLQRYHLAFTDLMSEDKDIKFTLLSMPKYGILEKKENEDYYVLKPNDQFTQFDINEKIIRYTANTSIDETVRDFLYFDVSDASGNVQSNQVLTMKVKPKIKEPPILKVLSDVQVNEGGDAVIQPNILTVFDPDTPLSNLTVIIEKQPDFGFIENSRPIPGAENDLAGIPISSFPYIDLVEGYIKYMQVGHQGVEPEQDTVYIRITDGKLSSHQELVNITIRPINDETPHVFIDVLTVPVGSYAKITNSSLSVMDADTKADQLVITFDDLPKSGVIRKLQKGTLNFKNSQTLSKMDSFSFQDILDGLILYVHEDFKSYRNDSFALIVSDGYHSVLETLNVVVILTDREVPFLIRNVGLELTPGNSTTISNEILQATDSDSSDPLLIYTLTSDPTSGQLQLLQNGENKTVSINKYIPSVHSFTQNDIDNQNLIYRHNIADPIGLHYFKFSVKDPANNILMGQTFFITITEDIFPPVITRNIGLKVNERSQGCITSEMLAAVDEHRKTLDLPFSIFAPPSFGYLEHKFKNGAPLKTFLMSDLKAGDVCYVHSSGIPISLDSFTFNVTDGKNSVLQTFYINITSIYDSLPIVKLGPFHVKEGDQKVITEFEIDIFDKDTQDHDVMIEIIKPPLHGMIENAGNLTLLFSAKDIKLGKISYLHDGSESADDNFSMIISDGFNKEFMYISNTKNVTSNSPIVFAIKIIQIDDEFPKLIKNEGIKGLIINKDKVEDVNDGIVQYVLNNDNFLSTDDQFIFSIEDTKPNKLFNNRFKIEWTRVNFNSSSYNVSESDEFLEIPIFRRGFNKEDIDAFCKVSETKSSGKSSIIPVANEIRFEENVDMKHCVFKLHDDSKYDGKKHYKIVLESSTALLGNLHAVLVNVSDEEDEPVISFTEKFFQVNESGNYFHFPVTRRGDLSHELSVMCTTENGTAQGSSASGIETGSDFKSRISHYNSYITFPPGVSEVPCSVKIVDDNLYEEEESFRLILSDVHPVGKLQKDPTALVIIKGPNDVPQVSLKKEVRDLFYGQKNVTVPVLREGVDLSRECILFCGVRLLKSSEENLIFMQEIKFKPFETLVDCQLSLNFNESSSTEEEKINIFLNNAVGCSLTDRNNLSFPLKKEKIKPVVEFTISQFTVKEDSGTIQIPIIRSKDVSQNSTIYCITQDGSAHSREDFEERYLNRKTSVITFSANQKESFCTVNIYDDTIYEGKETFKVELASHKADTGTVIGAKKTVIIEMDDPEDATLIQLEKSEYVVPQHTFSNNISTSTKIPVLRYGDTSISSKIRVSTIDGSASSGLDYYAKSKLITFLPGEKKKNFEIEILYNKRRNWAVTFTVILGPDEVLNANIGNISRAIVRIASVQPTESLILPAVPLIISLLHYDNVTKGMTETPKSGYPLICITPCDTNYPDYAATGPLCKQSGINSSLLTYSWEIAMPLGEESMSPFETVADSTLFTSAHHKVLDSIYFRPQEIIRCIVQPIDSKNNLGIPLWSKMVKISSDIGFCHSAIRSPYAQLNLQSQPFIASLNYVNSSSSLHANKLHIHIEIPHEDGLLPLISTYPLHNIQFLLTQKIYRQQHVCSNLQGPSSTEKNKSFLKNSSPSENDLNLAFPYHGDKCDNKSGILYQHLNLKRCIWSFDAWYSMAELVQLCGGTVTSDFKARDTDQTYVTVLLPLYVTYVFAAAPSGWTTLEHRTELEFSFYYDTFLWKSGSHTDSSLNATVGIVRVGTNPAGHMFFEFKTVAKFYGCFVLDHHTLPGVKSSVSAPNSLDVQFDLELLWSEQTFDGPIQFWRSTSKYNLKDYSGYYKLHLIPCKVVTSQQLSLYDGYKYLPCIAQAPEKFELPIVFQQTNRPPPVSYALETFFQIFNNENVFLLNPFENSPNFQYIEYKEAFSKGDKIYGRVFWSPKQGLESAYRLNINEVIICAGKNGVTPVYDPTGKIYGKGPQYGCLLSNNNLKYKFILLDKHDPDVVTREIQGKPFDAKFIEDIPHFASLSGILGVDGFLFNVDPLYEISSSQQWFLQVVYFIKPINKARMHRSVGELGPLISREGNGSNIRVLFLNNMNSKEPSPIIAPINDHQQGFHVYFGIHHLLYIISALLIILGIVIIRSKRAHIEEMLTVSRVTRNSYAFRTFSETPSISFQNEICEIKCKQKLKKKEMYKVKVYTPKNELYAIDNSSGTEV